MINDFKLGIQVLKYGLNLRAAVIGTVILLVMGVILEIMAPLIAINGLYTGMGGMMVMQTICSVSVSSMVQTSALKKRLQTSVPVIMTACYILVVHTVFLLIKWIGCQTFHLVELSELSYKIVLEAIMLVIIVMYNAVALKKFLFPTIVFTVTYLGIYVYSVKHIMIMETDPLLSVEWAIVISYVILLVGCGVLYGVLSALYKFSYNKMSFETQLKRIC